MCSFCSFKCWFIFFNTLFLASGVALITIGVLQYSTYTQIGTFAGSGLSKIAIVLIAVGVTIALISLLGHAGAFLNNSSMVACFICILIVIILLEVLTGAAFYILRSRTALLQMNSAINTKAQAVIMDYSPENRHAINRIQEKGCIWAIKIFLIKNLMWVGAVCIALGVTEVFGVLVGVCLCLDIKRKNYESMS